MQGPPSADGAIALPGFPRLGRTLPTITSHLAAILCWRHLFLASAQFRAGLARFTPCDCAALARLLQTAGELNPSGTWTYVIFRAAIVQWYSDDISQWRGQTSEAAAPVLSRVYGITALNLTDAPVYGSTKYCKGVPCI